MGQGARAWFVAASLLLANACSGDSEVSFDPPPDPNGNAGSGGNNKQNNTQGGSSGASSAGGGNANSGSAHGGSAQAGNQNDAGHDTGGSGAAGSAAAGSSAAGSGTAGSGDGGAGGLAGMGGVAGTAGSASGAGGHAGNGGTTAGNGGTTAGNGGNSAGNGGTTAGNGGTTAGNGGNSAGNGGTTAGNGGKGGSGGGGNDDCVAASFGGHSYYFCGVVDSATAAFTKCQSFGMAMISVESAAENTFVLGKLEGTSWLGGTDALEEGQWRWATGAVFWDGGPKGTENEGLVEGVYNNFLVDQPNDGGADETPENCLGISASGWNDLLCTLSTLRAACESFDPDF